MSTHSWGRLRLAAFGAVVAAVVAASSHAYAGETTVVSIPPAGNGWSYSLVNNEYSDLSMSADGRYVTMLCRNSISGAQQGVLVRDRDRCETVAVITGYCFRPTLSADGRFVSYDNAYGALNIFDRVNHTTEQVNVGVGQFGEPISPAALSADARYVAFDARWSVAGGSRQLFVRDRISRETTLASAAFDGIPSDGQSWRPTISGDGKTVAFTSDAWDIDEDDWNDFADVFVRDMVRGTTRRVSVGMGGQEPNGPSDNARISADGRRVVFTSVASNLVPGDTNGAQDVFVRDLASGMTRRMSATAAGAEPLAGSQGEAKQPAISGDGSLVAFATLANLTPQDTRLTGWDVYVRNVDTGELRLANVSSAGAQDDAGAWSPAISADGAAIAFVSGGKNLVPTAGYLNGSVVYAHDMLETPTHSELWTASLTPTSGSNFTLHGRVRSRSTWGPMLSSQTVWLQRYTAGAWRDVASKVSSAAVVDFTVAESSVASYRLRSAGVASVYAPSESAAVTVVPKARSTSLALTGGKSVRVKKSYTLKGTVKPKSATGTVTVKWQLKTKGTYRTVKTVTAKLKSGAFSAKYTPKKKGAWRASVSYSKKVTSIVTYGKCSKTKSFAVK